MAKYIAQIIVTGAQIVGRAFVRAVRQELQASQAAARARSGAAGTSSATAGEAAKDAVTGMTVQEAKQILNLDNGVEIEKIEKNFQHLFEINDKKKGGSFYLQSKVVRAKERLDQEIQDSQQEASKKPEKDTKKAETGDSDQPKS